MFRFWKNGPTKSEFDRHWVCGAQYLNILLGLNTLLGGVWSYQNVSCFLYHDNFFSFQIFLHICSYLEAKFVICNLRLVCKSFNDIISDDSIWKSRIAKLLDGRYPSLPGRYILTVGKIDISFYHLASKLFSSLPQALTRQFKLFWHNHVCFYTLNE